MPVTRSTLFSRWQVTRGLVLVLCVAPLLRAQSSATVPASSDVYDRIEAIAAWYPVRGIFLGERPMSVRDALRAVALLRRQLDSAGNDARHVWAREQLELVQQALASTAAPRGSPRFSWRADALATNARVERILPNGLGGIDTTTGRLIGIDALRHSFDANRYGRPINAATVQILPAISVGGPMVALLAEPLLSTPSGVADSGGWTPALQRAYARIVFHNAAMRIGVDEIQWGQSHAGALFVSSNAAPLHAITLGTDTPITLPWLLRHVGPFRLTGLLADLGRGYPSHARLAGWQGSIQPWTNFELGVTVLAHTGGAGSPPATFLERVVDLFPVIDALAPQHADLQISNKVAGGNLRLRIPQWSGAEFYYELAIDDFDGRRLRSSLVEDAGHLLGLYVPTMIGSRHVGWRAEWQRTSLRLYEHSQYPAGLTFHERLIGNPLGPNAKGAYAGMRLDYDPTTTFEITLADERRNPSLFRSVVSGPRDQHFGFALDSLIPNVRRTRLSTSFERLVGPVTIAMAGGVARSWQVTERGRTEWMLELRMRRDFLRTF